MNKIFCVTILAAILPVGLLAERGSSESRDKNVTIIHGTSTADGKSEVGERILEECIISLPNINTLDPEITSANPFLKEVNGDPSRNEIVKTYSATLDINYMLYQKVLVVVTTNSIKGQEPVMKVMEKNLKQTKRFVSNPSEGDIFAGRSHRQYYFSSPEAAAADVKKRAAAWIKQQASVLCNK
ncbi:MAG: hypothetical protein GX640_23160 [Fibrobacter sp.]|nr:hypothetical protein [Fibrobacter sp.]